MLPAEQLLLIIGFATVVLAFLITSLLKKRIEVMEDKARKTKIERLRLVPKTLWYDRIDKTIEILNERGDGKLVVKYKGRNVRKAPVKRVRHSISSYNYPLRSDRLSAFVGENVVTPQLKTHIRSSQLEPPITEIDRYVSEMIIDFPGGGIQTGEVVEYGFRIEGLAELYIGAFETEDFTSMYTFAPTDLFQVVVKAPSNYIFNSSKYPEGARSEVIAYSYQIRDFNEEARSQGMISLSDDRKTLTLLVEKPVIGCVYKWFFRLKEETVAKTS